MVRSEAVVLDVMKVPATGDPTRAVVPVDAGAPAETVECDILVVGGGIGGVAGAWAAARRGHRVCLMEETDWLGGQMTAQGISALDEHLHIERFGGTRSYYAMREAIRDRYRARKRSPTRRSRSIRAHAGSPRWPSSHACGPCRARMASLRPRLRRDSSAVFLRYQSMRGGGRR